LLIHDLIGSLLHVVKENILQLVLNVFLPFSLVFSLTETKVIFLCQCIIFLSELFVLLLECDFEPVLKVADLEDALGLDPLASLDQEASLTPLVDNQALLDDVEEVIVEANSSILTLFTHCITNGEHVDVLKKLVFLFVLVQYTAFLVDVSLETLVESDNCAACGVVDEFPLFERELLHFKLIMLTIPATLMIAEYLNKVASVSQNKEKHYR
jgi:hypothetical protein